MYPIRLSTLAKKKAPRCCFVTTLKIVNFLTIETLTSFQLHETLLIPECISTYLSENSSARLQWRLQYNEIHQIFSADYLANENISCKVDIYPRTQGEVQLKCAGKALCSGRVCNDTTTLSFESGAKEGTGLFGEHTKLSVDVTISNQALVAG